jgi:hypothetical protein
LSKINSAPQLWAPSREQFNIVLPLFCWCRLFLFTSLHAQKELLQGRLPDGFTEGLIEQVGASSLSF